MYIAHVVYNIQNIYLFLSNHSWSGLKTLIVFYKQLSELLTAMEKHHVSFRRLFLYHWVVYKKNSGIPKDRLCSTWPVRYFWVQFGLTFNIDTPISTKWHQIGHNPYLIPSWCDHQKSYKDEPMCFRGVFLLEQGSLNIANSWIKHRTLENIPQGPMLYPWLFHVCPFHTVFVSVVHHATQSDSMLLAYTPSTVLYISPAITPTAPSSQEHSKTHLRPPSFALCMFCRY